VSLWQRIKQRASRPAEPTRRQVLEAHIEAFLERYLDVAREARRSDGKLSLSVLGDGQPSRVVVEAGLDRLEVVARSRGLGLWLLPDAFLPGATELTAPKRTLLAQLGFARERGGQYASSFEPRAQHTRLCDALERVLFEVLDHPADAFYSVSIEPERVPDNSQLMASIQHLVKVRDLDARRLLYQAFINALLYLPLTSPDDASVPAGVRVSGRSGLVDKGEEWTVYSDEQAFARAGLEPSEVALVSGVRLIRAAEAAGIAALRINPSSRIGGEFLRNEVWMMGDYLRKIGVL
jgi:hypothetical protein